MIVSCTVQVCFSYVIHSQASGNDNCTENAAVPSVSLNKFPRPVSKKVLESDMSCSKLIKSYNLAPIPSSPKVTLFTFQIFLDMGGRFTLSDSQDFEQICQI